MMDADARILSAALHWLMNHYEINSQDPDLRNVVIARVEQILKHREPTTADMERLRGYTRIFRWRSMMNEAMTDNLTCETKLLPCPFCGGEWEHHNETVQIPLGFRTIPYLFCHHCEYSIRKSDCNTRNGQLQTDIGGRKES